MSKPMTKVNNIFCLPSKLQTKDGGELFETLTGSSDLQVERIISTGQTTPEGKWYDQPKDEWVILLQGTASLLFGDGELTHLSHGDYVLIPAHRKHRVVATSSEPVCIWLAIHGQLI